MSFLDKFKTKGRDTGKREDRDDDIGSMFDEVVPVHPQDLVLAGAGGRALALDQNAITTLTPPPPQGQHDSSMMSEALASEVGGCRSRWARYRPAGRCTLQVGQYVLEGKNMSDANQTLGMGWLPDYPSLRDHTVNHDVVSARLKELGQTQSIKSLLASVNAVAVPS